MQQAWTGKVISVVVTIQCSGRSMPRRASGLSYGHGELRACLMDTGEFQTCLMDTGDTVKEGFGCVLWTLETLPRRDSGMSYGHRRQTRYWHFSCVGHVNNTCTMERNYCTLISARVSLCIVINFSVNLAVFLRKKWLLIWMTHFCERFERVELIVIFTKLPNFCLTCTFFGVTTSNIVPFLPQHSHSSGFECLHFCPQNRPSLALWD